MCTWIEHARGFRRIGCGLLLVLVAWGGCRRVAAPSSQPVAGPEIVLTAPEAAARSLLDGLRAELAAVARGDHAAAAQQRRRLAEQVLARTDILARYKALPGHVAQDDAQMLDTLLKSWGATIAYYADGLALDQMRLAAAGAEGHKAVVDVPARVRDDRVVLRMQCVRGADELWHVGAVEFAPAQRPSTAPAATVPATQAAREPSGDL